MVTKKKTNSKPTSSGKCQFGVCKKAGQSSRGGGVAKRPPSNSLPTPPITPPLPPVSSSKKQPKSNEVKQNNISDNYTANDITDDEAETITRASLLKQEVGQTIKKTAKGGIIGAAVSGAIGCVQGAILGAPMGTGQAIANCANYGLAAAKAGGSYGAGVGSAMGLGRTAMEQTLFDPKQPKTSLKRAKKVGDIAEASIATAAVIAGGYKASRGGRGVGGGGSEGDGGGGGGGGEGPKEYVKGEQIQTSLNKISSAIKSTVRGVNQRRQLILESQTLQTVANYVSKPISDILKAINKDRRLLELKAKELSERQMKREANVILKELLEEIIAEETSNIARKGIQWKQTEMTDIQPIPSTSENAAKYQEEMTLRKKFEQMSEDAYMGYRKEMGLAPMDVSRSPVYSSNSSSKSSPTLPNSPVALTSSPRSMSTDTSAMSMMSVNSSHPSPPISDVIPGTTPAQTVVRRPSLPIVFMSDVIPGTTPAQTVAEMTDIQPIPSTSENAAKYQEEMTLRKKFEQMSEDAYMGYRKEMGLAPMDVSRSPVYSSNSSSKSSPTLPNSPVALTSSPRSMSTDTSAMSMMSVNSSHPSPPQKSLTGKKAIKRKGMTTATVKPSFIKKQRQVVIPKPPILPPPQPPRQPQPKIKTQTSLQPVKKTVTSKVTSKSTVDQFKDYINDLQRSGNVGAYQASKPLLNKYERLSTKLKKATTLAEKQELQIRLSELLQKMKFRLSVV